MKYEPREHQVIADRFLSGHDRGCLFLDMGLGKSVITLTKLEQYIYEDCRINRALVIAPKKVAEDTWTREAEKWDHLHGLRISLVLGTEKQRIASLEKCADIYVINRENVQWLVEHYGSKWPFDALIIDELSSFKSTKAKRWRLLKRVAPLCRIVWGLTGTPAANGYMDLYAEMYLIDGGERLGKTLTAYRERYFAPGAHKGNIVYDWRLKRGAKDEIDRKLSDDCLSMRSEDWLTLPDRISVTDYVHMTGPERKLYDQFQTEHVLPLLAGELTDDIGAAENAVLGPTAAAISGKLLQMANGNVYDDEGHVFHIHDQKLERLSEIAESGDSLLVYYGYRHDRDAILARFPEARELNGPADITDWNSGKIRILLCHPASVAYGLNLQEGGHVVVWYGLTWSLELYQQANARLYRQGQEKPVIIRHILTAGTLDERVMAALDRKDAVQSELLNALKQYLEEKK